MIIRKLSSEPHSVYLTFDDGPDPVGTPRVLDILAQQGVKATFYLVAEKARANRDLLMRIRAEGHAIGNHSWDHRYRNYFRGPDHLERWMKRASDEFESLGVGPVSGFRPPAGVITPALIKAARRLNLPLVLWNERFYDAVLPWTFAKASESAKRLKPGSIVLLHDRQSPAQADRFCQILSSYITRLKDRGFNFDKLPSSAELAKLS